MHARYLGGRLPGRLQFLRDLAGVKRPSEHYALTDPHRADFHATVNKRLLGIVGIASPGCAAVQDGDHPRRGDGLYALQRCHGRLKVHEGRPHRHHHKVGSAGRHPGRGVGARPSRRCVEVHHARPGAGDPLPLGTKPAWRCCQYQRRRGSAPLTPPGGRTLRVKRSSTTTLRPCCTSTTARCRASVVSPAPPLALMIAMVYMLRSLCSARLLPALCTLPIVGAGAVPGGGAGGA